MCVLCYSPSGSLKPLLPVCGESKHTSSANNAIFSTTSGSSNSANRGPREAKEAKGDLDGMLIYSLYLQLVMLFVLLLRSSV